MPKLKTHKGTAKRVKLTGSGKIQRRRAYRGHNLTKKDPARKRNYVKEFEITGRAKKTIKQSLGI